MLNKKYDITQCALYKCRSKKRLANLLNLSYETLASIDSVVSYHKFRMYKSGTTEKREITAPNNDLKRVQKRILVLLQRVTRPSWLLSGEKGKSYIDNGKAHIDSRFALMVDIRKFYENCGRESVYRFFREKLKVAPDIAEVLTDITTHDMIIPTGCPTSQILAYYAYCDMFEEIAETAAEHKCVFTLYVDDMTFSSPSPFNKDKLCSEVDRVLRKYGHRPKYEKTKYYSKGDTKPITGTIVTPDNQLDIPNSLQSKVFNGFKELKVLTLDSDINEETVRKYSTVCGQIQAANSIDSGRFREIGRIMRGHMKDLRM